MNDLPTINAFWVGPKLGRMHAACLQSFADQGHRVVLHIYDSSPEDLPPDVETDDAGKLLNRDRLIQHRKTGSLALASDIFRYELMAAEAGIYVDCDCFCVAPLEETEFILGWQSDLVITGSVLKLPADSRLLTAMRKIGQTTGFIPPWEQQRKQRRYKMRALFGRPVPLSKMRWGAMGPSALTYYVEQFGLGGRVQPIDTFYPILYQQVSLLYDPELSIQDLVTPRTRIIHLWNECLGRIERSPPMGSPLDVINKTVVAR